MGRKIIAEMVPMMLRVMKMMILLKESIMAYWMV